MIKNACVREKKTRDIRMESSLLEATRILQKPFHFCYSC